jgi:hypothetical protein
MPGGRGTAEREARPACQDVCWRWLLWVNALLEEADLAADLETGC